MVQRFADPRTRIALAGRLVLYVVLALLALTIGPAPVVRAVGESEPDLRLRIWPDPDRVGRGDVIAYDMTLDNVGSNRATRVNMTLPFDSQHLTLVQTWFDNSNTWVSELDNESVTVMFGTLRGGESRRAKLFFKVNATAPDWLEIKMRGTVRWSTKIPDQRVRSNWTTVVVVGQADITPRAVAAPAEGPAGTLFHFTITNYFPTEKIAVWLNTPSGVQAVDIARLTNDQGNTELELDTHDLAPGEYSLVAYGRTSQITQVAPFAIR